MEIISDKNAGNYKRKKLEEVMIAYQDGFFEKYEGDEYFLAIDDRGYLHIESNQPDENNRRVIIRYTEMEQSYIRMTVNSHRILKEEVLDIYRIFNGRVLDVPAYNELNKPIYV